MGKSIMFSKRLKSLIAGAAIAASAILPVNTLPITAADVEKNYAKALQYSQFFYDANMCGTGVDENNLYNWRGDCHVYDAKLPLDSTNTNMSDSFIKKYKDVLDPDGDGTVDVSGGFHDAGDHVKFGMPEAYSGSTLGWGFYEFREAYVTKNSVILRLMQSLSRHMVDFEGYEYTYINNTLSNCWIFKIENSLIF